MSECTTKGCSGECVLDEKVFGVAEKNESATRSEKELDDLSNLFFVRTLEHIHRVQKNMLTLVTKYAGELGLNDETRRQLMHNVIQHDISKFSHNQYVPYVELTEYYRQRKVLGNKTYEYPEGFRERVNVAIQHHYAVENHHPEGTGRRWDIFNALECACDLQAMAQEFSEGTCRKYFEDVWLPNQRANFPYTEHFFQVKEWIDSAIRCFEKELAELAKTDAAGGVG